MAVKRFFARNKEIFTHGMFVDIRFPYFFLTARSGFVSKATCCSKENPMVSVAKTLWFFEAFIDDTIVVPWYQKSMQEV